MRGPYCGRIAGASIFHCTTGPRDALWLPAGWLFKERVHAADLLGIRRSFLSMAQKDVLAGINQHLLMLQAPSDGLQQTVGQLILMESSG